jgi:hypothetical protein
MSLRDDATGYSFPQKGNHVLGTNRTGKIINQFFKFLKGVDIEIEFSIKDENGQAIKLFSKIINAILVKSVEGDELLIKRLVITDPENGLAKLYIKSSEIINLDVGYYEMVLIINNENENIVPVYKKSSLNTNYTVEILENYISTDPNAVNVENFTDIFSNGVLYSEELKASGQTAISYGNMTVSLSATNFTGYFGIEASLAIEPTGHDWFPVSITRTSDNQTYDNFTGTDAFTFEGMFQWVRFIYKIDDGIIDNIIYLV